MSGTGRQKSGLVGASGAEPHRYKKKTLTKKQKRIRVLLIVIGVLAALALGVTALWFGTVRAPQVAPPPQQDDGEGGTTAMTRPEGIYNVLLVGKDHVALNTDTLILASLDTRTNHVNLLSIPRDTMSNVKRSNKKINGAYGRTGKADINNLLEEIEGLIGFRPDNYVLVNLDGFVDLIDEIGGVEVDVPRDMKYNDAAQDLHIDIKKGLQTLDGETAMGFVRYRSGYAEGDIGRVRAQQLFMKAIAKKMMDPANLTKIDKYAAFMMDHVKTDLSLGEMIWYATQLVNLDAETDVETYMLPGTPGMYNKLSYYIADEKEALEIINAHFNPYDQAITSLNLIDVGSISGGSKKESGSQSGSSKSAGSSGSSGSETKPSDTPSGGSSKPPSNTETTDGEKEAKPAVPPDETPEGTGQESGQQTPAEPDGGGGGVQPDPDGGDGDLETTPTIG